MSPYKWKKPKEYTSEFEALTAALNLSYRRGVEYYACELESGAVWHVKLEGMGDRNTSKPQRTGNIQYRKVIGSRTMGWSRGLHKELGDDNPCPIMFKVEVECKRYTW